MGSVQLNHNGECTDDTSGEQFLSPDSSDIYNVFGDPELLPRVGDQYQVEIPAMITESEYLLYKKNPFEVESAPCFPIDFLMGLSIPLMWINKEGPQSLGYSNRKKSNKNGVLKSETNKEAQKGEDSKHKLEPGEIAQRDEGCYLVPGSFGGLWSDIEEESFLLGLYIFGKNLLLVKKFIVCKTMGDVLSFYYGKFYRSDKYRRWTDCRNTRSRKCVYGQKIFTGLRQQELISRLFLHVSEECQKTLVEVSKTFGDGKMSLEEYVSTLKSIVGMKSLVEAVGIGKGKQDLTGITMEPSKSNQVVPTRKEIPIGKACSSLTQTEIIKFLTGDFRLSKARSNDLFWEAVWPRLLARGWHSEQPKDHNYARGYKHSLVFLMPGVKKFSRRRLVRGNDFFDSVTDVLSKVASDPALLELETEADESNGNKEENGWKTETNTEQDDDSFDRQRHCYLQPRTQNRVTDLMKFTVVDTSLADGKVFNVRELRTLPNEVSMMTLSRSQSEEREEGSSEASSEDLDCVDDSMLSDQEDTNNSNSTKTLSTIERNLELASASVKSCKDLNDLCENKQPRKLKKCSLGMKQDDLTYLAPVTKRRRRLSACTRAETSHRVPSISLHPSLVQEKLICYSDSTDSSENNLFANNPSQRRVSSTDSSKGSPIESSEAISCDTNVGAKGHFGDKPQPRPLIDLNLPQVSPDFETGEENEARKPENSAAPKPSADVELSDQQPNMNSRRQSTRNRPLTVRALEALANGFLTTTTRKKNKEKHPRENPRSRPSRRARGRMEISEKVEVGNGVCNNESEIFSEFQVVSEGNAAQITGHQDNVMGNFQV